MHLFFRIFFFFFFAADQNKIQLFSVNSLHWHISKLLRKAFMLLSSLFLSNMFSDILSFLFITHKHTWHTFTDSVDVPNSTTGPIDLTDQITTHQERMWSVSVVDCWKSQYGFLAFRHSSLHQHASAFTRPIWQSLPLLLLFSCYVLLFILSLIVTVSFFSSHLLSLISFSPHLLLFNPSSLSYLQLDFSIFLSISHLICPLISFTLLLLHLVVLFFLLFCYSPSPSSCFLVSLLLLKFTFILEGCV